MLKMLKFSTLAMAFMLFANLAFSQGATTAALKGKVVDDKGNALENANVVLVHEPSGSQYGAMTMQDGRFTIVGARVGGPYKVIISSVGYSNKEQTGIYLNLNQTLQLSFTLKQTDQQIEEVTVSYDKADDMSMERTGAETFVRSKEINSLPTISRGQKDFTRLTPQSDGNSFGGRNNLYNNFSLDGSIFNNSFGLDYATPGGQANAQPVSLDAIEQIQVSLAPFDVREGGFTGAGVNAVTRSGTNDIDASVYYYFRNEGMIGKKVGDTEVENLDFNTKLFGFRVGGPIIKNKLFFFINAEGERRDELAHGFVARDDASQTDPNVTSVYRDDIQRVKDHLMNEWAYDAGAFEGYNHNTYNDKILAKLDWNISDKHHFTIRYNYLDASKDILPHPEAIIGRGPTSYRLPFENSSYRIFNKINSVVGEINSRFGNKMSNKLLVGYTTFRDHREPKSEPFPVIDIFDANGNLAITAGSEMFSTHNVLNQNVFQFTDNFTYYMNKHTLTAGVNLEVFKFENSFNLFYYPWHMYFTLNDFLNTTVADVDYNAEVATAQQKPYAESYVDVAQLGFYIQDEFSATDNLNLSFGLRMDVPIYLNSIDPDPEVQNFDGWKDEDGNAVKVDPSKWPDANMLWAPRFGFNWDTKGDKTLMLRGGTGIFSGRIPFVWLGNQASNSRMSPGYTFQINSTADGFKFPQVWKSDLAVDYKFAQSWIFSFEGIYSKDINAVVHRNYDMLKPSANLSGTGDNRAVFAGFNETHIYASSANAIGFLDAGTIVMDNVKEGNQYSLTGQLKKNFDFGLSANIAYTYMQSKDYTSIPAEIAADAFQRNPVVGDPNQPMYSYSRYGLKHRIIATLMYRKEYGFMASSFAMFWEAGQGNRYSYTYVGDLNQDGISNNDLLYIPASQSDINFGTIDGTGAGVPAADADAQWTALNAFIEQDPYMSEHRGEYAERHGAMQPWFSQVDFKFMQDFSFKTGEKTNTLRLSFDIMNMGNMFSSNWGVRQMPTTTNPITVNGLDNNNVPYFSFNPDLKETFIDDVSIISKWQLQIGVRWIFH
jgi:hypothetical protein